MFIYFQNIRRPRPRSNQFWTLDKSFIFLDIEPDQMFTQDSVQFSHSVVSDSLRPHESQHPRLPCPPPTPRVHSNSCPSSRWCHPAISSSLIPFSSCPQSLPASGSCQMSQLFAWGGQSIEASTSASVLPVNTQDWSPLGWTGWISSQSKGLSRIFSNLLGSNMLVLSYGPVDIYRWLGINDP